MTDSLPAPTGGWNARDSLAEMPDTDAIVMDNYFPGTATVDLRTGSLRFATITGVTTPVESLISYASGAATKLLAAANSSLYNVTPGGAIGSALTNSYTNNRWQYENMNGYTLMFNGADTPQKFDGSSITANTITGSGLTPSNLIYPNLFKHRLFMVEKNSLNVWYLDLDAISGAASKLDFSSYCKLGGYMVAMGSLTRDGGDGPDDYAVFITSRGEVLVYQGTDPANASTWSLVGVFRVGAPIGQRPLVKDGADLIVICEDGFAPLSRVLPLDRIAAEQYAISDKIRQAASDATTNYRGNFGWEGIMYPQSNWGLFNIPLIENGSSQQFVVNQLNNSWCRFTGLNANCWALFNNKLYFGSNNGIVVQADTGTGDDNLSRSSQMLLPIQADIKTSFQYFSKRSTLKDFKMVRPVVSTSGAANLAVAVSVDYDDTAPSSVNTPAVTGAVWNTSPWNTTPWSVSNVIRKDWLGVVGSGYSAALRIRTITTGISISLNSVDWLYEPGGVM